MESIYWTANDYLRRTVNVWREAARALSRKQYGGNGARAVNMMEHKGTPEHAR